MKNRFWTKAKHSFLLFSFLFLAPLFAERTPIPSLYQYKLENGLSLFVCENHAVPLTYIEVAVKCGAFTQTKETAGLFHLYEHMMFKGNALYPNAASVTRALSKMGVSDWNGTTGLECVNYFFTVPSEQTRVGLEFWNAAIRKPLISKKELNNEKKVVLSEIQGNMAEPQRIISSAKSKALFPNHPYKLDPSGSLQVVSNATVKQLKEIQKKFYIPNNTCIFVGGDINPDEVFKMVSEIYGDWKPGANPFQKPQVQEDTNPFLEPCKFVMPYDKISEQVAQISVTYRGPDALFDEVDTYPADVLCSLLSNPKSAFVQNLVNDGYIGIPDVSYLYAGYPTSRQAGMFNFFAVVTSPLEELAQRSVYFYESVKPNVLKTCKVSQEEICNVVRKINDESIFVNETPESLLSVLRFWWICTSEDYYFNYQTNMSKVQSDNLADFVQKYFSRNPLITVLVNPKIYQETKQQFLDSGFTEITAENAFWFYDK